ncbi:MAG: bacillithiol biosynthesis BshC [Planctomycetota bacterium]
MKITSAESAPTPDLLARYLGGDPALSGRLGGAPGDEASVLQSLERCRARPYARATLVAGLLRFQHLVEAGEPALANSRALLDENTFIVATGQQPGLLTGPLYTLWKAVTAIAQARHLTRRLGIRFVPLFWVASDDHDLGEVEGCFLLNRAAEVQRFRVPLEPRGSPSAGIEVASSAATLFETFLEALPDGADRDLLRSFAAPRMGERWPVWFGRILAHLFRSSGLVLFEPHMARDLLEPVLQAEARQPARAPSALRAGAEALRSLGLEASLPTDAPSGLFVLESGRRRRFDPDREGEAGLSPDAGLRAAVQSLVLPAPVVVAGPGEVAYWLQLTELFEALGAPRPVLLPRLRATLIEPRVRRALTSLGLGDEGLFRSEEELRSARPATHPARAVQLAGEADEVFGRLCRLTSGLDGLGGSVPKSCRKLEQTFRTSLDRLIRQALDQEREQQGVSERQLRLVAGTGRPRGLLQERVLNGLPFVASYGLELLECIVERMDPCRFDHLLIEPDSGRPGSD